MIQQRFIEIRKLRNRVFHHQRIWNLPDLRERKRDMVEALSWIEPFLVEFFQQLDTFEQVYAHGVTLYKEKTFSVMKKQLLEIE